MAVSTRPVLSALSQATRAAPFSAAAAGPSSASTAGAGAGAGKLPLTWPHYLSLRRQRRLWSTITTVPTTAAGLVLGGGYFAGLEADPTQTIMGIEPMYVYAGATLGCMALGYLVGPSLGSSLFSLTHPKLTRGSPAPLQIMDREFFHRIRARRVDPSFQSVNNPAPDFYGEKITSLATYRRWLRDQAAYKRKAMHGVPGEAPL
ncbi:TIM23 complex component [Cryptotrichosporon argae]